MKLQKKKSIFRFEALIPFGIIIFILSIYFHFFFHSHVKKLVEFAGTWANGAEVNIDSFHSSIFDASFEFKNIEVTNPQKPTHNSIQIERIYFRALWDGLLRGKLISNLANVENIALDSQRRTVGKIVSQATSTSREATVKKITQVTTDHVQEEFSGNALADMASIVGGTSPNKQIKNIQTNLNSSQHIDKLQREFAQKKSIWEEKIKTLPKTEDLKSMELELKSIQTSNFKNISEFQKSLQTLQKITREAKQKYKNVTQTGQSLNSDLKKFQKELREIETLVKNDIKNLEKRFRIPSLDPKELSLSLFKKQLSPYLKKFDQYMKVVEEYIPPKKTNEQIEAERSENLTPNERHKGRDYHFDSSVSYPTLWLKKVVISSKANKEKKIGAIKGEILNISTNQAQVNQPLTAQLSGDFPRENIKGIHAKLIIDHRTIESIEKLDFSVSSYPMASQKISNSPEIKLILEKANGKIRVSAKRNDGHTIMNIHNSFSSLEYKVNAKTKEVKTIVSNIMREIPIISVKAKAIGSFPLMSWDISSNLGTELQKGFSKQLQIKINEAKNKLNKEVKNIISKQKSRLTQDFDKFKNQYQKDITNLGNKFKKIQNLSENHISQAKKKEEEKVKNKVTQELKKVLKEKKSKELLENLKKQFNF